jgi:F-type H+-transporting ATPase subunit b
MATENAVIVIAQAETGHTEMVPVEGEHAEATDAHTETTGEANLEHAEAGMPQLDVALYPNLIFWLVVALLATYFILSRVALPRIGRVLAERNDAIANDIEQAAVLKRRAEEAEAAYNTALARARDEAHKIAAETKAQIDKELSSLLAKADAEIAVKSRESEKRIAEIGDSAAKSVEEVARETAAAIVASLMPDLADGATVDAAVANRLKG